jgi:O-antigen/teichoic acid export membrane protein
VTPEHDRNVLTLAKGASVSLIGSVSGRLFLFLTYVIIARVFGPEPLGIFVLAVVAVKIAALIARLGLDTAAIRFVSVSHKDSPGRVKGTIISSVAISFLAGVALAIALYFSATFLSQRLFQQPELESLIRILSIGVPFLSSMLVVARSTQGFQTTRYLVWIRDMAQPLFNLVFLIIFIVLDAGIEGAAYAFIVSHAVAMSWGLYLIASKGLLDLRGATRAEYDIVHLLSYSTPLWVTSFLVFLMGWTDTIMLGAMRTSYEVGIYRAAAQIPLVLSMILVASNSIYAPVCANLYAQGKIGPLGRLLKTSTRWVACLTLPIGLAIILSARPLMHIFGSEFVYPGAHILVILAVAQLVNTMAGAVGLTLSMTGKQKLQMLNSVVMITVNAIMNLVLIPRFGAVGAAIATGASLVAINLLMLLEVYLSRNVHPYSYDYLRVVAASCFAGSIVGLLSNILNINSVVLKTLTNFCIAPAIFLLFIITLGLPDEDKQLLKNLVAKVRSFRAAT